jgi:Rrf2 family protein
MLSKKTRYAIQALAKLGREYGNGAIMISEIASSENIPQRFLENILLDLKNLGFLGSKLGKKGGYYLLRSPSEIKMSSIIRHFEGTIALSYCVSEKAYRPCEFCRDESTCKLKGMFQTIRDNTFAILDQTSISEIM